MLDDANLLQDADQPQVVTRVQADRRLVEDIQRAHQRRPERGRQVDPLGLPARQRGRHAVQRQVGQADIAQERQALPDLAQDLLGDRFVAGIQLEAVEERRGLVDRQRTDGVNGAATHPDIACLLTQSGPAAVGTDEIAAVPAEKHPHVDLVFLPLEPPEEAPNAFVVAVAVDHEGALGVAQLLPGHVEPDPLRPRRPLQVGQLRPIVRLAPRLDGILLNRLGRVGHDQPQVELDHVPESVAGRAGPKGVVEREQPRLRQLVGNRAGAALEALAEDMAGRLGVGIRLLDQLDREGRATALQIGHLDGIGDAREQIGSGPQLDAVDDDVQRRSPFQRRQVDVIEAHDPSIDVQPAEPAPSQGVDRGRHRLDDRIVRRARLAPAIASGVLSAHVVTFSLSVGPVLLGVAQRLNDGHLEAKQQPRSLRQLAQLHRGHLGRFSDDITAAASADRLADAGPEQPEVIVNLGGRPHGRPRVADAVLLADGDGRRDAVDPVDVGLLHPLQELSRVSRQRFDVAPLALRIDRVERQRRFPRSADARHDDQLVGRQLEIDPLQVVRARAGDDEVAVLAWGGFGHRSSVHGAEFLQPSNRPC